MIKIKNFFNKQQTEDERQSDTYIEGGRRKGESENPYFSARRTWNDHMGSIIATRRMWQTVGIISMLIVLVAVGGLINVAGQSKFIPYIIEVDKLGKVVASGPVSSTNKADPRIIKSTVAEFISDARLVTPDIVLQRDAIFRIYSHLATNDPATQKMNEWLNGDAESSPFNRAKKVMVSVEIKSVIPQTPDTWQIDWEETTRDRNGGIVDGPISLRGLTTVYTAEPSPNTTEEEIRKNPLGIYVRDYSWQKIL